MKTIILILVMSYSALGQQEWQLLQEFDSVEFKQWDIYQHLGFYRAPWSSWAGGFHPTNRIQIDIAVNYQALQVLWADKTILVEDLYKLYWEMPMESLELFKRGNKIEVYKALFWPAYDQYNILPSAEWINFDGQIANPSDGWYRRTVRGAPYPMETLPIAIKSAGQYLGEQYWVVSVCMILDRKYN